MTKTFEKIQALASTAPNHATTSIAASFMRAVVTEAKDETAQMAKFQKLHAHAAKLNDAQRDALFALVDALNAK